MLTVLKFVTGYIPQGISFILAIFAFCKVKIPKKQFLLSSALMIVIIWLVRQLPISMGVNILPNILALVALSYGINKLPLTRAVIGSFGVTIIMLCIELLDILVFALIYGQKRFDILMQDDMFKTTMAIPSMIVFSGLIIFAYFYRTRKRKN